MAVNSFVRKPASIGLGMAEKVAFIAPLATRVVVGLTYMQTGWGKWQHFSRIVEFFHTLGIPFPTVNAFIVASLELMGGSLIIAGLLTRLCAMGLSVTMVVALLTADRQAFLISWTMASNTGPANVLAFTLLIFLLWLAFYGPGVVSLDALLKRWIFGGKKGGR